MKVTWFNKYWPQLLQRLSLLKSRIGVWWAEWSRRQRDNPQQVSAPGASRSIGYVPIAVVTLAGIIVSWNAYREVNDWERQRVLQEFHFAASDRILMVQRELELALGVVRDIGSFFDASSRIGRREYRKYVGPALNRYKSIVALEWIPRVTEEERAAFETNARRSFARFRMTEPGPNNDLVDVMPRSVHFPVLYVQPYQENKERLGLDLAADPDTKLKLLQTSDAGIMQLSSRIPLAAAGEEEFGFQAWLPLFESGDAVGDETEVEEELAEETVGQGGKRLRGFAAGVFHIGSIVESALANLSPSGIDIVIYDVSGDAEKSFLYRHESRKRTGSSDDAITGKSTADNRAFVQTISLANRQWEVVCNPLPRYFQLDTRSGWAVLAGGWAFTILLAIYLSTLVDRAAKIKRLVTERTLQLTLANAALNKEVAERTTAERELQLLNDTLEHRVAERTAQAEQHIRELEQFAYVTSHDLKAPLRNVANLATWLEEDLEDKHTEASREQLQLLRDRVQRMDALIEGLLEYSRIGRTEPAIDTVSVGELLDEVVDSLALPPGFTITINKDMPTLRTERLLLYQVFSNLVSNAVKHHGSSKGTVKIKVKDLGRFYQFTVADDGPGIAPQYHDKVFKIFQTLEARDYGSNTGIGLALVKKIVQEHGGSISLKSEEGKGAKFRFTWPKST